MTASVYSRALAKAAELVGGRAQLARVLQVAQAEIDRWIADRAKPPRDIFLRIVDLILDQTAVAASDESAEPPPDRGAAGPTRYAD